MKTLTFVVAAIVLLSLPASSISASTTLTLRLTLNSTTNTVFIPSVGDRTVSQLPSQTFTNPGHFFLSSTGNNVLSALVHSLTEPISLRAESVGNSHSLLLTQRLQNSQAFLTFTRSAPIVDTIERVEAGTFLLDPHTTFGYGTKKTQSVVLVANYTELTLQGNATIRRGIHTLVIEANNSASGPVVIVGVASAGT